MISIPIQSIEHWEEARQNIDDIAKKFDDRYSRFNVSCRQQLTVKGAELIAANYQKGKSDPNSYFCRCLLNEAIKFYTRIGKRRRKEVLVGDWNLQLSSNVPRRSQSPPGQGLVSGQKLESKAEQNEIDRKLDFQEFRNSLPQPLQEVLPVITKEIGAKKLASRLGVSTSTIYERCKRVITKGQIFFKEYQNDLD